MRSALGIGVLILLMMAACRPESNAPPSVFDVNLTSIARDSARLQTATLPTRTPTLTPTLIPTATINVITRVPPSATPPVDRSLYIGETFPMTAWSSAYWGDLAGTRRQLNEFKGRVLVVQTLSTESEAAKEQSQELAKTLDYLRTIGITEEQVQVVLLSIDGFDTRADLENYLANYGQAGWLAGIPNDDLKQDIGATFGEGFLSINGGGVFFADKGGFGQASVVGGFLNQNRLRDTLIHLVGTGEATPEATEEPPFIPTEATEETSP